MVAERPGAAGGNAEAGAGSRTRGHAGGRAGDKHILIYGQCGGVCDAVAQTVHLHGVGTGVGGADVGQCQRGASLAAQRRSVFGPLIGKWPAAVSHRAESDGAAGTVGLRHQRIGGRGRVEAEGGAVGHAVAVPGDFDAVIAGSGVADGRERQRRVGPAIQDNAVLFPDVAERAGARGGGGEGGRLTRALGLVRQRVNRGVGANGEQRTGIGDAASA